MTVINTNQPCDIGERMDALCDVTTHERPNVVLVVIASATRAEWEREWPENAPPFPEGYFYRASID